MFIHIPQYYNRLFLIFIFLMYFSYFSYNIIYCLPDAEFVILIKNMAIKNHNDPMIFEKIYNEATTNELKQQKFIANQFYECIFQHKEQIHTKKDINKLCGHFITFQ